MSRLDQALEDHQAGRLKEAEAIYRQILAQDARHADALHWLGVLTSQTGRPEEGLSLIERAIARNPRTAQYHNSRGQVLHMLGHVEAAIQAYRQAVDLNGADAQICQNLGDALVESGKPDEAIPVYRRAITLAPDSSELHNNIAMAFEAQGNLAAAITYFERALALKPESADINYNLGNVRQRNGNLPEAAIAYQRALALRPDFAEAHNNLGTILAQQENLLAAMACYQQAMALNPDYIEAYSNLGSALRQSNRLTEAVTNLKHALTLDPGYADAHHNLAVALLARCQVTDAIAEYRRALALEPKAKTHSSLLLCMHYDPAMTPKALFTEASRWHEQHALPLAEAIELHSNTRDPDRRLRIGYVSSDFRSHSVAYFVEAVLAEHDRERFEVFCYANVKRPDVMTERLRGLANHWRDIVRLSDEEAAHLICNDEIDILIDLAGHTAGNRLLVFARKPAPVQMAYLGYPNTRGLPAIDYWLTDKYADPPGAEGFYVEHVLRLPQGFNCYQPPSRSFPVSTLPALSAGHVTFGSFNNAAKVNEAVIALWARVLRTLPTARLILKARALGDTGVRKRVGATFAAEGVSPERLELIDWLPEAAAHLSLYHRVDIAMDTFPYNGHTTTCEALWMGVPVITLAGQTHAGRVGVSLLNQVGLHEFVAECPEEYVSLTVTLASDLEHLRNLRQGLRERLQRSSLMDAPRFIRSLEAAYRRTWENYCKANSKKLSNK